MSGSAPATLEARARLSGGTSAPAIYRLAARVLDECGAGGLLLDVGCGSGGLWSYVRHRFASYVGVDVERYEGFPAEGELILRDLEGGLTGLNDGIADVVAALETIEHLENPRAFMRALVRVARPGGWVVVTTPNQLSVLSLVTLAVRGRFAAFQDVHYPAHLTALLEADLRRIAAECGLAAVSVRYSGEGRVALTARHYPAWVCRLSPRLFSDNVLIVGRRR